MSGQSRRVLERLSLHIISLLEIFEASLRDINQSGSTNTLLREYLIDQINKFEADLLDLEIKRAFPDYIPPWQRDPQ